MKKNAIIIIGLLFVSAFLSSCFRKTSEAIESTTAATYDQSVSSIIKKNCYFCHSGAKAKAGVQLDNYEGLKKHASDGALMNRINDAQNPMPPKGLMSEAERNRIKQWADEGYKKN